jgi:hypothetical protein
LYQYDEAMNVINLSRVPTSSAADEDLSFPIGDAEQGGFSECEQYLRELDKFELSEREKMEWLAALQLIVVAFVDQALNKQEELSEKQQANPYDGENQYSV